MSSILRVITNSLGSNDKTIIIYDGDEIYNGSSSIPTEFFYRYTVSFGSGDHNVLHYLSDEDFNNWEEVIYR